MSIQQNMHFESGLLNVDASGDFSLEDAKQAFLEMLGAIAQCKAKKILFDGRKVKGNPKDSERFQYAEFVARETHRIVVEHKIAPRFAYVMRQPLRDPGRYGEKAINGRYEAKFKVLRDSNIPLKKKKVRCFLRQRNWSWTGKS